jgi:hypothetical protein
MDRDRSYHTAVTGVQIGGYSRAGRRATDTLRDRHRASVPGSVWRPGQARERVMCLNAASSGRRPDPGAGPARCDAYIASWVNGSPFPGWPGPFPVRVSLAAGTRADGGCTGRVAAQNKRGLPAGPLGTVTRVATMTRLRTPVRVP